MIGVENWYLLCLPILSQQGYLPHVLHRLHYVRQSLTVNYSLVGDHIDWTGA